ncbi:MAG: membrane-bound O-acyltransferase family protein [Arcobacter sp.]|nr:MAG: membrane-bound O-acyltransferase family protein [Arcobacter sp.]
MLFNSYIFIFIFLPITFFVYFYLNQKKLTQASKAWIVFTSLFFYSWWNVIYLPLILGSMLFNYIIGNILSKRKSSKKTILLFGIVANILLLAYFKYTDFFIENLNFLMNSNIELLHLALPLAISFFTFQQIAYLVDSYRNETKEYDFLNYAVFVTFFPQLIAGPIVHHKEMMPQFANLRNKIINYRNIAAGLFIFSIGLFKKVAIADTFAVWANKGFDASTTLNFFEAWATSLSYTFQLYFDFSGYTDMAIGLALLFNIKLPINFNSPYKAKDIQDFWRRWHITLSRFLKDYVYVPLGGNRKGEFRTYNNLLATFIIGGIWHGAGWTFVFWGTLHGVALIIHRAWSKLGFKLWTWLAWLVTFNFVNIAWVFFRAKEWDDAIKVLSGMFKFDSIGLSKHFAHFINYLNPFSEYLTFGHIKYQPFTSVYTLEMILFGLFIVMFRKNSIELLNNFKYKFYQVIFIVVSIWVFHFMSISTIESQFLYFNF